MLVYILDNFYCFLIIDVRRIYYFLDFWFVSLAVGRAYVYEGLKNNIEK